MGLKAVLEVAEVRLQSFSRCENDAGFCHASDIRGLGLELVDVHSGFADLHDGHPVSAHLVDHVSDQRME